ncbi:MAG: hypothetical protein KDA55_07115 [Planctomycetales bacterium]|nr:hypothetical protein [Planctomycetales bacterium]
MEFRRSGVRDDRRRRVLMEDAPREKDANSDGDETASNAKRDRGPHRGPRYSEAARNEQQPRLTDWIPQRPWTLTVWGLLGLAAVCAVEALYVLVFSSPRVARMASLEPLDVLASGSVAAWFSSLVLFAAAMVAIQVFAIRRHRLDDYRGRYRIWLPMSLFLFAASLDAGCGLHRIAAELASTLSEGSAIGRPEQIGIAGYALLAAAISLRMVFELRESRLTLVSLGFALVGYASAGALRAGAISLDLPFLDALVGSTATLLGHVALLGSLVLYCRHVYLDAHGLLPERAARAPRVKKEKPAKAKPRRAKKDAASAEEAAKSNTLANKSKRNRSDLDSPAESETADSARAKVKAGPRPEQNAASAPTLRMPEADDEGDDDAENANLSRADRRRQKKQQRRDTRRAA